MGGPMTVEEMERVLLQQEEELLSSMAGVQGVMTKTDTDDEKVTRLLRGSSLGWSGKRLADALILIGRAEQLARATLVVAWRLGKPALHAVARTVADLTAAPVPQQWRDHQVDLTVEGRRGDVREIEVDPQCRAFVGRRIMATDSAAKPGTGTRIGYVLVGQRQQRPVGQRRTLTEFFAQNARGNDVEWQCRLGETVRMEVEFTEDCRFDAVVLGKRLVEKGEQA